MSDQLKDKIKASITCVKTDKFEYDLDPKLEANFDVKLDNGKYYPIFDEAKQALYGSSLSKEEKKIMLTYLSILSELYLDYPFKNIKTIGIINWDQPHEYCFKLTHLKFVDVKKTFDDSTIYDLWINYNPKLFDKKGLGIAIKYYNEHKTTSKMGSNITFINSFIYSILYAI